MNPRKNIQRYYMDLYGDEHPLALGSWVKYDDHAAAIAASDAALREKDAEIERYRKGLQDVLEAAQPPMHSRHVAIRQIAEKALGDEQ